MVGSDKKIVWQPNSKPQAFFLGCPFPEMLFGGARGPGKTDSLIMSYIQFVGRGYGADWKGIIFRQTYKQLEEIVAKSRRFFPKIIRGATFGAGKYEWTFPGGETLKFRHAKRPADMENYQGHEYPFVGFDELCNLPSQEVYEKAKGFCRSSNPRVPKMIRCTANPLGPGHLWVKRYFVEPEEPLTPIVDASGSKRVFIPATIYDNTHLVTADPDYLRRLESIADDSLRRAWLEGDWDVVAGSFFGDVWSPARNVLKPFKIPAEWYCYRSFDWGSAKPFSVGWWAISDGNKAPDGNTYPRGAIIRIAEWYGAKRDNAGQT
ncbi:MAG: terminase, partial [Proteobacteria bacterium]|nr:terminase [Pseudomonadota bacterium]